MSPCNRAGFDAQRMQGRLDTFLGTKTEVPQGGVSGCSLSGLNGSLFIGRSSTERGWRRSVLGEKTGPALQR